MLCYVVIVEYSVLIMSSSSSSSFRARNLSSSRVIRYDSCVNQRRWKTKVAAAPWSSGASPRLDRGGGGSFCRRRRCRRAVKHSSHLAAPTHDLARRYCSHPGQAPVEPERYRISCWLVVAAAAILRREHNRIRFGFWISARALYGYSINDALLGATDQRHTPASLVTVCIFWRLTCNSSLIYDFMFTSVTSFSEEEVSYSFKLFYYF